MSGKRGGSGKHGKASSSRSSRDAMGDTDPFAMGGESRLNLPYAPPGPVRGALETLVREWQAVEVERAQWELERSALRRRLLDLESIVNSHQYVRLDLVRRIKLLEHALAQERKLRAAGVLSNAAPSARAPPGDAHGSESRARRAASEQQREEEAPNDDSPRPAATEERSEQPQRRSSLTRSASTGATVLQSAFHTPPSAYAPASAPASASASASGLRARDAHRRRGSGGDLLQVPGGMAWGDSSSPDDDDDDDSDGDGGVGQQAGDLPRRSASGGNPERSARRAKERLQKARKMYRTLPTNFSAAPNPTELEPSRQFLREYLMELGMAEKVEQLDRLGKKSRARVRSPSPLRVDGMSSVLRARSASRTPSPFASPTHTPSPRPDAPPSLPGAGALPSGGSSSPHQQETQQLRRQQEAHTRAQDEAAGAAAASPTPRRPSALEQAMEAISREHGSISGAPAGARSPSLSPPAAARASGASSSGSAVGATSGSGSGSGVLQLSGSFAKWGASGRPMQLRTTLKSHLDSVRALAFETSGPGLLSGSEDGTVKLWDVADVLVPAKGLLAKGGRAKARKSHGKRDSVEPVYTFRGHLGMVTDVAMAEHPSAENGLAFSAGVDSRVVVWDLPSMEQSPYASFGSNNLYKRAVLDFHTDAVWKVVAHGRGVAAASLVLFSAGADGQVLTWKMNADGSMASTPLNCFMYSDEAFGIRVPASMTVMRTDPGKLVVGFTNGEVAQVDIETSQCIATLQVDQGAGDAHLTDMAAHPTSGVIVTSHADRNLRMFDFAAGECAWRLPVHRSAVSSVSIDPSGSTMVSASHDETMRFWDFASRKFIQDLEGYEAHRRKYDEAINRVRYHPTFNVVASGGADSLIKLFSQN